MLWVDMGAKVFARHLARMREGRALAEAVGNDRGYQADRRILVDRVRRLRNAGYEVDGVHMMVAREIDDIDYALLDADNACAAHFGAESGWTQDEIFTGRWLAINPTSELAKRTDFGNSHASKPKGSDHWITESAYFRTPHHRAQVSPDEVVWHYLETRRLNKAGFDAIDRSVELKRLRAQRPWDKW